MSGRGIGESVMWIISGTPAIAAVLRASLTGSVVYSQTRFGPYLNLTPIARSGFSRIVRAHPSGSA